jgi:myo-inositol-1(or 4)-monophosphatase
MKHYLDAADNAAREAGELLRKNFYRPQHVNAALAHDIKLEIDVKTQELITKTLPNSFPSTPFTAKRESSATNRANTSGSSIHWTAP